MEKTVQIRLSSLIFFAVLAAISCVDHNVMSYRNEGGFYIKTGRHCGWCGGIDTLTLRADQTLYAFYPNCDEEDKFRLEETNAQRWSELLATFDWEAFKAINVNTCFVCTDGCDTFIKIRHEGEVHEVRFMYNSPEVEPIRPFITQLELWAYEFR